MPSWSATIMANAVAWPWPWADVPAVTVAVPSSWTSTEPYSLADPPAVISTYVRHADAEQHPVAALGAGPPARRRRSS